MVFGGHVPVIRRGNAKPPWLLPIPVRWSKSTIPIRTNLVDMYAIVESTSKCNFTRILCEMCTTLSSRSIRRRLVGSQIEEEIKGFTELSKTLKMMYQKISSRIAVYIFIKIIKKMLTSKNLDVHDNIQFVIK